MHKDLVKKNEVVIIGGGITGLTAAYFSAIAGNSVTVIESSDSFGGLLNTFKIGNNRLEFFYHHFFTHDAELHWLVKELGIDEELFFKKTTMGVYHKGAIYNFNSAPDLMRFKPISLIDKVLFGLSSLYLGKIAKWENFESVSSFDWLSKWAGKTTMEALWRPLLNIKFGPFSQYVPLSWMIGRLRQRMNSRKGKDERLGYIRGSLHVLLQALLQRLKDLGVTLLNNSPIDTIMITDGKVKGVAIGQKIIEGEQFLFTLPGVILSDLLSLAAPKLAQSIKRIQYFGAICIVLELEKPLSDIYWLNIADDTFPFGGIIEHTNFIAPEEYDGVHIAYLSRYFELNEPVASYSKEKWEEIVFEYLPKVFSNFNKSNIKKIHLFKTSTAATVCDLQFSQKVPKCKTDVDGLYIANMSHVYPDERSVNNSIRIAAEACRVMGSDTSFLPRNNSLSGLIGF